MLEMLCSLASLSRPSGNSCCCCSPLFAALAGELPATFDMFTRVVCHVSRTTRIGLPTRTRRQTPFLRMRRDARRCKQWIALNRGQRPSPPVLQVSALGTDCCRSCQPLRCSLRDAPYVIREINKEPGVYSRQCGGSESSWSSTHRILFSYLDLYSLLFPRLHTRSRACMCYTFIQFIPIFCVERKHVLGTGPLIH